MEFPKEKMEIVPAHEGKASEKGWLVLHISALDLEGISKVFVNLDEVENLKGHGARHEEMLERMRSLLGAED
ncbi:MAG TPA: hypothetical protein VHR86_06170 [Armatimonadota bacterium]|nr:hypothetical protein [Armatimonadota bacterium]